MRTAFKLDPVLEADSHLIGRRSLCQIRLMDDKRFPWLVLVPERPGLSELHDVAHEDQAQLLEEIGAASRALAAATSAHKMNVAALGNQVPQLHIHLIARFKSDPAWPSPIWGKGNPIRYGVDERDEKCAWLRWVLAL